MQRSTLDVRIRRLNRSPRCKGFFSSADPPAARLNQIRVCADNWSATDGAPLVAEDIVCLVNKLDMQMSPDYYPESRVREVTKRPRSRKCSFVRAILTSLWHGSPSYPVQSGDDSGLPRQKAVSAHSKSEKLLPFGFKRHCSGPRRRDWPSTESKLGMRTKQEYFNSGAKLQPILQLTKCKCFELNSHSLKFWRIQVTVLPVLIVIRNISCK